MQNKTLMGMWEVTGNRVCISLFSYTVDTWQNFCYKQKKNMDGCDRGAGSFFVITLICLKKSIAVKGEELVTVDYIFFYK